MVLSSLILGFFVKIVTGFDDTITKVPVLSKVARTKLGRVAFSVGTLVAISAAIVIAIVFSSFLQNFPYARYITAGLVFALAAAIHFDLFVHKPRTKAEEKLHKYEKIKAEPFMKLIGIGFIASFATVIDDIVVYTPLFLQGINVYAIVGILIATILEIVIVIYFAQKISKIKYTDEIASIGLVILGVLILFGIV